MPPRNAPRQHERVRAKRDYTIPHIVVEQGFVTMQHQHHVERVERLARKGIVIADSRFREKMVTVAVKVNLHSDDVKDLEAGHTIEKEYYCNDCEGRDAFKFTLRRAGENPEWTIRTGEAPPDTKQVVQGEVKVERTDN